MEEKNQSMETRERERKKEMKMLIQNITGKVWPRPAPDP